MMSVLTKSKSSKAVSDIMSHLIQLQQAHEQELEELRAEHQAEVSKLKEEVQFLRKQLATKGEQSVVSIVNVDHGKDAQVEKEEPEVVRGNIAFDSKLGDPTLSFLEDKRAFIEFVLAASRSTATKEYEQLYSFLLKCFRDADTNFDGRVGFREFEYLIEQAALLPRRFGFAPSSAELYTTDWDKTKQRMTLFRSLQPKKAKKIDEKSTENAFEYLTFSMWLEYAVSHVKEKARGLDDINPASKMNQSAAEFKEFMESAFESRTSQEYKELYHFVLQCFSRADTNLDGLIDFDGFDSFITYAEHTPRRFGFPPLCKSMSGSGEPDRAARQVIFDIVDVDKKGYVDFSACLEYVYTQLCEQVVRKKGTPSIPLAAPRAMTGSTVLGM